MKRFCFVLAVVSALSVGSATADEAIFRDRDEQPFCEGPGPCPDGDYMDFRRLTQGHGEQPRRVRHGLRTAERWRSRALEGRHGTTIVFEFETDRYGDADMQLRVRRKDGRWRAYLYEGKYFFRHVPGKVRVWRPGRRSLKVGFSADLLRDGIRRYRWTAWHYDRNLACPGSCHTDHAPDRGWYEHQVR